jgi:DNA polymerase-1
VGEKTAMKFIAEFETMENLLANTDKLKGKMREKVEENKELGLLSKELAKILIDCDVTFDAKDYELSMPDGEKVQELFEELEFRRLKDQFLQLFSTSPSDVLPLTPSQGGGTGSSKTPPPGTERSRCVVGAGGRTSEGLVLNNCKN